MSLLLLSLRLVAICRLVQSLAGQFRHGKSGSSERDSELMQGRAEVQSFSPFAIDAHGQIENAEALARMSSMHEVKKPKVVLLVLESELKAQYVNRSLASLHKYDYDFELMDAVDGRKLGVDGIQNLTHLNFHSTLSPAVQGCFASHVMAWRKAQHLGRPVISLESDTHAVSPWIINPSVYDRYDLLVAHNSPLQDSPCDYSKGQHVLPGMSTTYGTGAILFTGRNVPLLEKMLQKQTIHEPIDHWMNHLVSNNALKVGALCPNMFEAAIQHKSTVEGSGFHK